MQGRGGGQFSQGDSRSPRSGRKVAGAARGVEVGPPVAARRQAGGGDASAVRRFRKACEGFEHRRLAAGQGIARRARIKRRVNDR